MAKRESAERELDDELRFHFDACVEKHVRAGRSREEALRLARLEFGAADAVKEECRDARGVSLLETFVQDVRYGLRGLLRTPALTAILVLTLALGIGANTAIFSLVNAFLFRPLPVRSPQQIVVLAIQQQGAPVGSGGFSYPEFADFRKQGEAFSDVFGIVLTSVGVHEGDSTEQAFGNYVTSGFFGALGIRPALGRFLRPDEGETPGEPLLVVLSDGYWQRRFHGDEGVIGRQIAINGKSATIVGVAPRGFQGLYSIFETDVYLPLSAILSEEPATLFWNGRDEHRILGFARLRPGETIAQAQSSLDVISGRLARAYPATDKWYSVRAVPEKLARPIPYANNTFVAISGLFLILAAFVLLLACMNIENILLARGSARQREMAIRAALGAGRRRLMRQMLTETLLLAALGGAAGIVLGGWANRAASSIRLQNIPLHLDATFDWRVFTFAAAVTLLAGIVVGVLPAARASSADVNSMLHEGGQRSFLGMHRPAIRNFLVVAQVAGAVVVLVAAGLFVRSMQKVQGLDLGFDSNHLLNVTIDPHESGYADPQAVSIYRDLESKIAALPGVQSVSAASYVPFGGFPTRAAIEIEEHLARPGEPPPSVLFNRVDPSYFATMRVAVLRGRSFSDGDDEHALPVAIVNQTMARRLWPHDDPVGKRFQMNGDRGTRLEIVGVVADGKYQTVNEDPQPFIYLPLAQNFVARRTLHIRSDLAPESLIAAVKGAIASAAPGLSVGDIQTMQHLLAGALGFFAFRLVAALGTILGTIGLVLGVVGVYGVVSFAAVQRTREIGIRMALGANAKDVLALVWRHGIRLVLAGVAGGLVGAWALTRSMAHFLAGVSATDSVTYISVAGLLLAAGWVACWIPARRAMRVDPMVALRCE